MLGWRRDTPLAQQSSRSQLCHLRPLLSIRLWPQAQATGFRMPASAIHLF